MLEARTKQINSYGKRSHRIVTASDERRLTKEIPSIFDEPEVRTQWAPVASRMRKRETRSKNSSTTSSSSSPFVIHVQRRRPLMSPLRRKRAGDTRVQHLQDESQRLETSKDLVKPSRPPLAPCRLNLPSSPVTKGFRKRTGTPKVPKKLHKPVSNVIDVDIIVLDEYGSTIANEHRISYTNVQTSATGRSVLPKARKSLDKDPAESDDELVTQPRQTGFKRQRAVRRIISDDSDSEEGGLATPPPRASRPPIISNVRINQLPHTQADVVPPKVTQSRTPAEPREPTIPVRTEPSTRFVPLHQQTQSKVASLPSNGHNTHVPSPIIRPRQLTPIRGTRMFRRTALPPSPATPTDFDTSIDLSDLELESSNCPTYRCDPSVPEHLKPLLQECRQEECGLYEFSAFIKSFPHDPVIRLSPTDDNTDCSFRKIGEASYSEVFGIGGVVLKVIPLRDESPRRNGGKTNDHELNGPATSEAKDVRKEIIVTRAMGEVCDGFVKLLRAYVVRGRYPELLLQLWDEYNQTRGSESVRPDTFTASQAYAIIVLPNGGPDLETYTFTNAGKTGWRQACSIFWQVSKALAHAEQLVSFEHRDLHWGQILVKDLPTNFVAALGNLSLTDFMDCPTYGVQATIIDLGLSRMDASDSKGREKVYWTVIDEEVFMGEGDYQFDVYRLMRERVAADWAGFNPLTNVMWLHYLVLKLLQSKHLRSPTARAAQATTTKFTEKECYKSLLEMEGLLSKCIKGKGRRKTRVTAGPQNLRNFTCAGDVVYHGAQKGWIMPIA